MLVLIIRIIIKFITIIICCVLIIIKTIVINKALNVQKEGLVLLDYKILGSESKKT